MYLFLELSVLSIKSDFEKGMETECSKVDKCFAEIPKQNGDNFYKN